MMMDREKQIEGFRHREAYDAALRELQGELFDAYGLGPYSAVMRLVDPIQYVTGYHDWCDAEGLTDE